MAESSSQPQACGTCTAISLNFQSPCPSPAVVPKPPFCTFHKKQCQALYAGYKRRNAELDTLEKSPPQLLPKNIGNNDFGNVNDVQVLQAIHEYLLKKFGLLNRCILAREMHHSHFYKDTSDFGHQGYLDKLKTGRNLLTTVVGRIERRMMQLKYDKEHWYAWIRKLQMEEEKRSEAEKKRVKAAAELEKKHQATLAALKGDEEKNLEELEKEEVWDPVEHTIGEIRMGYVALVRTMCNATTDKEEKAVAKKRADEIGAEMAKGGLGKITGSREEHLKKVLEQRKGKKGDFVAFYEGDPNAPSDDLQREFNIGGMMSPEQVNALTAKTLQEKLVEVRKKKETGVITGKKTGKKGRKKAKAKQKNGGKAPEEEVADDDGYDEEQDLQDMLQVLNTGQFQNIDPSRMVIMPDFSRLTMKDGQMVKRDPDEDEDEEITNAPDRDILRGIRQLRDFIDDIKPRYYDADYPLEEDIHKAQQKFADQSRAIREYQLLRNILSNSSLLSVAIECDSIDEFLNDTERVRNTDLRDLALGLSKTTMQDVQSACSDYWLNEVMKNNGVNTIAKRGDKKGKGKRGEEEVQGLDRIKVCGRWLHNYPMESRLPRRGWFQFGLLTFASWQTALSLCKSWDECYE
jgi:hypothetical protein